MPQTRLPAHRRRCCRHGASLLRAGLVAGVLGAVPLAGAHAQTQQDMNMAASKQRAAADATLNDHYGRLLAKLSPEGKDALRSAQRSWLAFRDQECAFETMGSRDGSIHPMVVAECQTRLTKARTTDLDRQLNCEEGDVACGNQ